MSEVSAIKRRALLTALKDDFTLSSWIYLGALLQSILFFIYPYRVVALPCVLIIGYRILVTLLMQTGAIHDPLYHKAVIGRHTAQVVNRDGSIPSKPSENQIVVFILGSCPNNAARGRLRQEDGGEINELFIKMWLDVYKNREKLGFLGKTSTLYASDDEYDNVTAWISYWRSIEDLQAFARGSSHIAGLKWWAQKDRSNIGLMHETYLVPAGNWETIYANMRPFGLSDSKQPFTTASGETGLTNGVIPARGSAYSSLRARMGFEKHKPFDWNFYKTDLE